MKINTATKKYMIGMAFTCGLLMSSGLANAATVACPGTDGTGDREFQLDTATVATCLASGVGNINGNSDAINALGYITLDKSDNNSSDMLYPLALTIVGSGTLGGSFSFVAPSGYFNFVIAFKSGQGDLDPDWAAFALPAGVTSGLWSIISGEQSLSHANLYAKECPGECSPLETVPLPAGILLLISAIGGLGFLARFRKAGAAA